MEMKMAIFHSTLLISLLPSAVVALFLNPNGVVKPDDPYVYIGNNLTLTCNLTKYDAMYDSQFLKFSRKSDVVIPDRYITVTSTRSILLNYPITSPDDGGSYLCKLTRSNSRPEIIGIQSVTVEYEPKAVTAIDCRVYDWENMTCTWELGVEFVHPNTIDIDLIWAIQDYQHNCPHQTRTSCSWLAVDGNNSFISDMPYTMGVSITNRATKPETYYPPRIVGNKVDTSTLVEPAPVSDLGAVKNSTCITLGWRHKKVRRDKVYRVGFKQLFSSQWETKNVDDHETLTLCGLHAHTQYMFNVSCKPRLLNGKVEGFWSKPVSLIVQTDEDVPSRSPEISPGSYMETPCQHMCKKLVLYWKPIPLGEANGNITYYRIDYRNINAGTEWEMTSMTATQGLLMLVDTASYVIQLRAATNRGVSSVYSEIIVPPVGEKPDVPEHTVEAENMKENTRVKVSWIPPPVRKSSFWKNLTSYTVYWCGGIRLEKRCQEPIQSVEVPLSEREINLNVRKMETYMFGVAVNAESFEGKAISSGFKWNMCIYTKFAKPEKSVQNVRLCTYQPSSGLCVDWERLTCQNSDAFIQHYLVQYCPASKGDNCTDSVQSYTVDNTADFFNILDLEEGERYKVWINPLGEGGRGPDSQAIFSVVVDRRLKTGEIVGIAIGALFVLIIFLIGIVLCTRRVLHTVKQKYFVPVPIVTHTLPPLPPIPMPQRQLSPDSDSSDGIYEKIDGPPSPCSSTESTTGVEAPLIHSKWKLSTLKSQLYGRRRDQRNSNDSGRGSLSHSADTLLMRLHPSHLRKYKKSKKSNRSESDSGVIVDGRGQVCTYTSGHSVKSVRLARPTVLDNQNMEKYDFECCEKLSKSADVNPYSCVDIVDKMNSNSEKMVRKGSESMLGCVPGDGERYKGSTLSLPPGLCKMSSFVSQPLNTCGKAKSAGNQLDMEERRLSSMKETREFENSDVYSEGSTLDSVGDHEHETSESGGSREPNGFLRSDGGHNCEPHLALCQQMAPCENCSACPVSITAGAMWAAPRVDGHSAGFQSGTSREGSNTSTTSGAKSQPPMDSYIHFVNGEARSLHPGGSNLDPGEGQGHCDCDCHSNRILNGSIGNGYVTEDVMMGHREGKCGCEIIREELRRNYNEVVNKSANYERSKNGHCPNSQMYNLPPHFFGSMSSVPVDPSRTTEL